MRKQPPRMYNQLPLRIAASTSLITYNFYRAQTIFQYNPPYSLSKEQLAMDFSGVIRKTKSIVGK